MAPKIRDSLHYIGGSWHESDNGDSAASVDPATSQVVGRASLGSAGLADDAARAARKAFEASHWQGAPRLRAEVLLDFAARLESRKEWLAELLVRENGKIKEPGAS